jgi:hypothetical protein
VLVQREMESPAFPIASITPIPPRHFVLPRPVALAEAQSLKKGFSWFQEGLGLGRPIHHGAPPDFGKSIGCRRMLAFTRGQTGEQAAFTGKRLTRLRAAPRRMRRVPVVRLSGDPLIECSVTRWHAYAEHVLGYVQWTT